VLAAALAAGALAAPARTGWGRPVRFAQPQSQDIVPAQIAFSPAGEAAVAFGVQNTDNPAVSDAFATIRSPAGAVGAPARVPDSLDVLGLTFAGSTLELLTGTSPHGLACCGTVHVIPLPSRARRFGSETTVVRGLTGITDGQLLTLANGDLLAALATERGVWVAQSDTGGQFGAGRRLVFGGAPGDLAATALANGGSVVAWTTASGGYGAQPRRILVAAGSPTQAPSGPTVAVAVAPGHSIDELALAADANTPTLAWVESWYDARGGYHSAVKIRDLTRSGRTQTISPSFEYGSDVAVAANSRGDQVIAFDGCSTTGACVARAAVRRAVDNFGRPQWLGPIDPSQAVAATISARGEALVGWVNGGHVLAAARGVHSRAFGPVRIVSSTNYASDLTLAFGPGRDGLAAWTQGTLAPIVVGAPYHGS
jgi:hypothetical protein